MKGKQMLTKFRARAAEESGFTLVELLIVIAILGVLAGVVVFSVAGITDNGQTSACKTEASTVRAAEEAFYAKSTATPTVYTDGAGLVTAKLLNAAPTLVTAAFTGSGTTAAYTVKWASASCGTVGADAT
jgi:general secretion pathway protein G